MHIDTTAKMQTMRKAHSGSRGAQAAKRRTNVSSSATNAHHAV